MKDKSNTNFGKAPNAWFLKTKFPNYWKSLFLVVILSIIYIFHENGINYLTVIGSTILIIVQIHEFQKEMKQNEIENYAYSIAVLVAILLMFVGFYWSWNRSIQIAIIVGTISGPIIAYIFSILYQENITKKDRECQAKEWYRRLYIILNNRELKRLVENKDMALAVNQGTYEKYENIFENLERLWIDKPDNVDAVIAEKIFEIISELQNISAPASISFICKRMPQKIKQIRILVKKHID